MRCNGFLRPVNALATMVFAFTLVALAGCTTEPVQSLPRQAAAPLPNLETARTRAEHEEIAAWYEREAKWANEQAVAHRRMLGIYASPEPGLSSVGFVEHCENLILGHQQTAGDNLALAMLHRHVAEDVAE